MVLSDILFVQPTLRFIILSSLRFQIQSTGAC
ncbi:Uncharacterised protein [Vibrio cholerae]|nr:Uncharacterised protein [Vibrio cholerae]